MIPEINCVDMPFLRLLAKTGEALQLSECLADPLPGNRCHFSGDQAGFCRDADAFLDALSGDDGLESLAKLHLTANFLLTPDRRASWAEDWVRERLQPDAIFPGVPWNRIVQGRWAVVPLLLVAGNVITRYVLTGWLSEPAPGQPWPAWASGVLDDGARHAVQSAIFASRSLLKNPAGFPYFFPVSSTRSKGRIRGASLALPLALGFASSRLEEKIAPNIAITGGLSPDGTVTPVGHLAEKARHATAKRSPALIFPAANLPIMGFGLLEKLPVATIREAWLFARLYTPGKARSLLELAAMLDDPEMFVRRMDRLDPDWVQWVWREGLGRRIATAMLEEPRLLSAFGDGLRIAIDRWEMELAQILADFIPLERLRTAVTRSPLSSLKYCTRRIALANHLGNISAADNWGQEGRLHFDGALRADLDACADFLNHRFVSRQNRFSFSRDLPEEIRAVLHVLERRWEIEREAGCLADRPLGELYGSIAQQFGFCGPGCLDLCVEYAGKAQEAFGGGRVLEFEDDVIRQYGYMVYAALDAGHLDHARVSLLKYLKTSSLNLIDDLNRWTRWQHAALARFLADGGSKHEQEAYLERAYGLSLNLVGDGHPHQLWLFNIGRMALSMGLVGKASTLFRKSIELCMSTGSGPTVAAMALLSLAGIQALGTESLEAFRVPLRIALEAAELVNSGHFQEILKADTDDLLRRVWSTPERWFPFTFR